MQINLQDTTKLQESDMIKSEIIAKLCEKMPNLPEKLIADAVGEIIEHMTETLCQNRRIEIRGFGSFSLHYRPPRKAHNPKTGERLLTEAKYSPHFKPGKLLKDRVNDSKDRVDIKNDFTDPSTHDDDDDRSSSGSSGHDSYMSRAQY